MTKMSDLFKLHDKIEKEILDDACHNIRTYVDICSALFGLMHATEESHQITPSFAAVIHSKDHELAHIHIYLKDSDIATENYYTRIIIPERSLTTTDEIQVISGDRRVNAKQKKRILRWFNDYAIKELKLTNYGAAVTVWKTFQRSTPTVGRN